MMKSNLNLAFLKIINLGILTVKLDKLIFHVYFTTCDHEMLLDAEAT